MLSARNSVTIQGYRHIEYKRIQKIYHGNNQRKAVTGILFCDKVEFTANQTHIGIVCNDKKGNLPRRHRNPKQVHIQHQS
jgi:hypothetical protein